MWCFQISLPVTRKAAGVGKIARVIGGDSLALHSNNVRKLQASLVAMVELMEDRLRTWTHASPGFLSHRQ